MWIFLNPFQMKLRRHDMWAWPPLAQLHKLCNLCEGFLCKHCKACTIAYQMWEISIFFKFKFNSCSENLNLISVALVVPFQSILAMEPIYTHLNTPCKMLILGRKWKSLLFQTQSLHLYKQRKIWYLDFLDRHGNLRCTIATLLVQDLRST